MNKIFKIIWNKTTQRLEVVSELAKSQGKATVSTDKRTEVTSAVKFKQNLLALFIASLLSVMQPAFSQVINTWDNRWKNNNTGGQTEEEDFAVITGRDNRYAPELANPAEKTKKGNGGVSIYGQNNNVTRGKWVLAMGSNNTFASSENIVGLGNKINVTASQKSKEGFITTIGNDINVTSDNNNKDGIGITTAIGNKLSVTNSHNAVALGGNISINSAKLGIGVDITTDQGGSALGYNISLKAREAGLGGTAKNNDSGFAVGYNVKGYGNHLFMGRDITYTANIANAGNLDNQNSTYIGNNISVAGGVESVFMGSTIKSTSDAAHRAVGVGSNITLSGNQERATVLGSDISVTGKYTVSIGTGVTVGGENAIGIGRNSTASADSANALGLGANATAANATAIGRYSVASTTDSVALGREAKANTSAGDVAIGSQSETSTVSALSEWTVGGANLSNSYSANVKSTTHGVVSVGSATVRRQIKNVAAGDVSATSTDAVNGAQLYWLSTKIGDTDYVHVKSTKTGNKGNAESGATGTNSVAVGPNASASGTSSIAIGDEAKATSAQGSLAVGQNANASNTNATAIGRDTTASGTDLLL